MVVVYVLPSTYFFIPKDPAKDLGKAREEITASLKKRHYLWRSDEKNRNQVLACSGWDHMLLLPREMNERSAVLANTRKYMLAEDIKFFSELGFDMFGPTYKVLAGGWVRVYEKLTGEEPARENSGHISDSKPKN